MKLAVFTSWYPARITTFFERDMRALVDAGVEVDVFAIAPLDPAMWQHSLDLLTRHIAGTHDRAGSLAFAVTIPEGEEIRAG